MSVLSGIWLKERKVEQGKSRAVSKEKDTTKGFTAFFEKWELTLRANKN